MYKISVPIKNTSLTSKTRDDYLKLLKASKIDRVFLVASESYDDEQKTQQLIASIKKNVDFLKDNGIDSAVWIGITIGHGYLFAGDIRQDAKSNKPLINLAGQTIGGTSCPLDESFRKRLSKQVADIARSGVKTIMLDDDFRLSVHGGEFCCACDEHMEVISKLCGENVSREQLKELAFNGKPNKYRSAWIKAQGDSLRLLANDIRRAVDEVAPDVSIFPCTSPCTWDVDGTSTVELAKILAGKNRSEARLIGAPYWVTHDARPFSMVFETERTYAALCRDSGVRIMAEGDVYPRPRYNTPSSHLELFDAVMRADGSFDGILKYMVGYHTSASYDTGYFERHVYNLKVMEEISEIFDGKTACGVYIPTRPSLFANADFSVGVAQERYTQPLAGNVLTSLSIPTTYDSQHGVCAAVFGEEARHVCADVIEKGAVLDGVAAVILKEQGIDVGLVGERRFESIRANATVPADESEKAFVLHKSARLLKTDLKTTAEVLIKIEVNGEYLPLIYRYENANGQRFLVYMTDTMAKQYVSDLCRGFMIQNSMTDTVEWVSRKKLPAKCLGNPDLYMLCKEKDGATSVGLFNCYADSILYPTVKLDKSYSEIRFVNCVGRLDGDTVYLDKPLGAFEFAAFEVK